MIPHDASLAATQLRELEARLEALADRSPDAVLIEVNGRIAYVNFAGVELLGADLVVGSLVGRGCLELISPDHRFTAAAMIAAAIEGKPRPSVSLAIVRADQTVMMAEYSVARLTRNGAAGLQVTLRTVPITSPGTGSHALVASSADRFRAALADVLRSYAEPGEVQAEAGRVLRRHLRADRVCYTDVSDTGEVGESASGGEVGPYPGGIDQAILIKSLAGLTTVVSDALADTTLSAIQRKKWSDLGIRAQVTVPWRKEERLLGLMTVYQLTPRVWTPQEVALMEETAERIGAAVGRARTESLLRSSEERYRSLFNAMDDAFCLIEVLLDESDGVIDYRFLEVNRSFGRHTGMTNPIGRTMRSLTPDHEQHWFNVYAEVARSGEPRRFEARAGSLGDKWFDVYAFRVGRPEERQVAIILEDITSRRELEQLQADLLQREHTARHAAEEATRAKDDFLAMLSHELRTPLNPVLMLASESAADAALSEDVRRQFATIRRNVELEARLIDDLLDVTRITRGKMVLDLQVVDAHEVLKEALRTIEPEIGDKEIKLTLELSAGKTHVLADPVRLQQILWNIVRNAAKFTAVGGAVTVATLDKPDSDVLAIRVTDTGIGMTTDELALAFEPFVQGRHASQRAAHQFGGLGLGLAISRKLAEMHHGTIEATSEGIGHGSTFTLELPVVNPPVPSAKDTSAVSNEPAKPQSLRILLVEDHEPTRRSLKRLLERRTHVVYEAGTVADGLTVLSDNEVDVLLSDLGLPDGEGHVLAECLRELQPTAVAIALSGYGRDEDLTRSVEAGFRGHLVKPIAIERLDHAISTALGQGTS